MIAYDLYVYTFIGVSNTIRNWLASIVISSLHIHFYWVYLPVKWGDFSNLYSSYISVTNFQAFPPGKSPSRNLRASKDSSERRAHGFGGFPGVGCGVTVFFFIIFPTKNGLV